MLPPPPPLPEQFPYVPTAPRAIGLYEISTPGMLVGIPLPTQAGSKAEPTRPRQFVVGEGFGSQGPEHQQTRE